MNKPKNNTKRAISSRVNGQLGGRPRKSAAALRAAGSFRAKQRAQEEIEADGNPKTNPWCVALRAELSRLRVAADDIELSIADYDETNLSAAAKMISAAAKQIHWLVFTPIPQEN